MSTSFKYYCRCRCCARLVVLHTDTVSTQWNLRLLLGSEARPPHSSAFTHLRQSSEEGMAWDSTELLTAPNSHPALRRPGVLSAGEGL